ncbi:MAG: alpha/beta fold hydrolase [Promethearchaeota archaeon]|jgi:pimeloyl-ACP methyl ester carboxylesterase
MLFEKRFDTGEVVLNYAEGPDNGPPFLILPAMDNRWQSYKSIIPSLKAQYHLFGLDARGRGKSGRTPGKYELKFLVKDTVAFLNQIVGEPSILFGHSNGGWISLWVAEKVPSFVSAIVYGDASLNLEALIAEGKTDEGKESYSKFSERYGKPVKELEEIFRKRYPTMNSEFIRIRAESFHQCDKGIGDQWAEGRIDKYFEGLSIERILKSMDQPLLIIQANPERGMITHKDVEWAKSLKPDLSHVYIEKVDHWLGLQDGREHLFLDGISPFLESLR